MSDPTVGLEQLEAAVRADPGSPAYATLAERLISIGRYQDAVHVCEAGLARNPLARGRLLLGEALLLLGEVERAFDSIEHAVAELPGDPRALRALGEAHLRTGRPDLAEQVLLESARRDPSDPRTLDLLSQAQQREGMTQPLPAPPASLWETADETATGGAPAPGPSGGPSLGLAGPAGAGE
ncbi:MAG: tetratricopeptide repeat protein, partial [Deltaproteobacteria bacterium]